MTVEYMVDKALRDGRVIGVIGVCSITEHHVVYCRERGDEFGTGELGQQGIFGVGDFYYQGLAWSGAVAQVSGVLG